MKIYGSQIMQAVVFILEGDHVAEIKEQVRLNTYLWTTLDAVMCECFIMFHN